MYFLIWTNNRTYDTAADIAPENSSSYNQVPFRTVKLDDKWMNDRDFDSSTFFAKPVKTLYRGIYGEIKIG
jgi:hypothetical protein